MSKQATTSIYIDKYHPKADGKCAVTIRVTFDRKKKYYPTKHKLSQEEYNKLYTPKHREPYKSVLQELVGLEDKAQGIIDELGDRFSFTLFEKRFSRKLSDNENVFSLLEDRAKELRKEGRISTAVTTECALSSLKKFHKKEKLSFDELNCEFLNKYKKWMQSEGNSSTTTGMYLRDVRTIFNEAINVGTIPQEIYPFGKGRDKFKIPTGRNLKKALSLNDIAEIYNYDAETGSEKKAKDFWLLSYLANGINIKDIALLKFKSIDGDIIRFERAKTKRANEDKPVIISFPITTDIKRIISEWGNKAISPDNYIFPILHNNVSPEEEYKLIQLFTHFINNHMKNIAEKLNIKANVTTYTARHSFSTVLRNSGASIEAISEALGHNSIKTTQNYLAGFEDDAKRKLAAELTNFSKLKAV